MRPHVPHWDCICTVDIRLLRKRVSASCTLCVNPQAWQQPQRWPWARHKCLIGQWQQWQQWFESAADWMDHQASTCSMLSMCNDPGAFANGLKGVWNVFVTSAYTFASIKLIGLATLETPNPPLKALLLPCHLSISSIGKCLWSQCDHPCMFFFHHPCTHAIKSNLFH